MAKRKANPSFFRPFKPSPILAEVIGTSNVTRCDATKKIWDYFKKNKLNKGREISADAKLKPLFRKEKITMFEVGKILNNNLTPAT